MDNSIQIENDQLSNTYNKEEVHYCKRCLSLKIKRVDDPMRLGFECYCDKCTSVDIDKTDIFSWQEMYKSKYGENYLNNGNKQKEWQKNVAFKMAQSK